MTGGPACLIPAAGRSSRFGRDKRALLAGGVPLLRRAVLTAREAGLFPVIVVCRREDPAAEPLVGDLGCSLVPRWDQGPDMAGSLRTGLASLGDGPSGAVVLLPDMPFVNAAMIRSLLVGPPDSIVACRYGGVVGPPVWFPRCHFAVLEEAGDGFGSRLEHRRHVRLVRFPAARGRDIDRVADARLLLDLKSP